MSEVEAGRELDALIAEKVMGWTVELIVGLEGTFEEWRDPQGWRYGPDPKPYSTDIAAAWQVVEHSDRQVQVRRLWVKAWDAWLWVAEFGLVSGEGDTAPLAICRAALAAVAQTATATG